MGGPFSTGGSSPGWRLAAALFAAAVLAGAGRRDGEADPPPTLAATGLYADAGALKVDPAHIGFTPQYPLWTDGAVKRRWISLPPGTAIDASDPDGWLFPAGTRIWKEFAFTGRRVETRYMELRADGRWLFAAYAWSADGREARLVPERGQRNAYPLSDGRSHSIPAVADCRVCHRTPSPIGFSALQLSPDRDALALHVDSEARSGIDLRALVARGLLVNLPDVLRETPPRIATDDATERAALGYLHGNCGHCHDDRGPLRGLGMVLRQPAIGDGQPARATTIGRQVRKAAPSQRPEAALRIAPGRPESSALIVRAASRSPALQMPPLGTELPDDEAVALLKRWVAGMTTNTAPPAIGEHP